MGLKSKPTNPNQPKPNQTKNNNKTTNTKPNKQQTLLSKGTLNFESESFRF